MDHTAQDRWDERYASGSYTLRDTPSELVTAWLPRLRGGRALDVATGAGRHALAMAAAGFEVEAVDISEVAIQTARARARELDLEVDWQVADLTEVTLPSSRYDLITVLRYRDPQLWPRLRRALAPGGWLIVEHHLRTHLDDAGGPSDDAFRLAPGELLHAFGDLRVVHYDERVEPADRGHGRFVLASLVACAGDPGW